MRPLFTKKGNPNPWSPGIPQRSQVERLLDQQFWCFGRDILLPPENLLVRFGLNRYPRRHSGDGSCYANRSSNGTILALWGFGVYFGDKSGVMLRRDSLVTWMVDEPLWPIRDLTPETFPKRATQEADQPTAHLLLAKLFRCFANYESWVSSTRPPSYGAESLLGWHRIVMPRDDMAAAWRTHAEQLEQLASFPQRKEATCLS